MSCIPLESWMEAKIVNELLQALMVFGLCMVERNFNLRLALLVFGLERPNQHPEPAAPFFIPDHALLNVQLFLLKQVNRS